LFNSPEATQTTALVHLINHTPDLPSQPLLPSPASQLLPRSQPKTPSCWETPNITKVACSLIDIIVHKTKIAAIYETAGHQQVVGSFMKKLDQLLSIGRSTQNFTLESVLKEIRGMGSVHIAASIFKRLFQRLETPLLEPIRADIRNAYKVKVPELKLEAFKTAIKRLDSDNRELFRITLKHLGTIAKNCSSTQMDSKKLAESFVPHFFKIKAENEHPQALGYAAACLVTPLAYLIDNADNLFE
ncbi:MAG TPA: Rho GTPase-activating protein, partial [Rhabdochlamydiaceae bacterium]